MRAYERLFSLCSWHKDAAAEAMRFGVLKRACAFLAMSLDFLGVQYRGMVTCWTCTVPRE